MVRSKRFRVAFAGCGRVANVHAASYRELPQCDIVAVADPLSDKLREFAQKWNVPSAYPSLDELLEKHEIDVLSVCTNEGTHSTCVIAAAKANVPGIYCEKPMGQSTEECDRMIAACQEGGSILSISHPIRYESNYQEAKRRLDEGEFGNLVSVEIEHTSGQTSLRQLLHDDHSFDAMCFFTGTEPLKAWGQVAGEEPHPWVLGVYEFPDSVYGRAVYGGRRKYGTYRIKLYAERGWIDIPHGPRNVLDSYGVNSWEPYPGLWTGKPGGRQGLEAPVPIPTVRNNPWRAQIEELLRALTDGTPVQSDGTAGRRAVEMIEALFRSQQLDGRAIQLNRWAEE